MNEVTEQEGQKGNLSKAEIEQSSGACTLGGILAASRRIISLENKLSRLLEATKRLVEVYAVGDFETEFKPALEQARQAIANAGQEKSTTQKPKQEGSS